MKKFETPELEIIEVAVADIVTVSGGTDEGEGGKGELPIG